MILVLNRLQQLSGNKLLILIAAFFLVACSSKLQTGNAQTITPAPDKDRSRPVLEERPQFIEKEVKPEIIISLVLPFDLNYKALNHKDLSKSELAIDYYQGFKLALDSVANNSNTNFKLQVFDSKDDPDNVAKLAADEGIKNSDLIVGPVFPNGISTFSKYVKAMKIPAVSPLAATDPSIFNNPYLITVNNSLDQHAYKALSFIKSDLKAKKIILIRSGQAEESKYAVPFKNGLDSLAKGITFAEIGIKAVGYENIFKSLNPVGLNVVVLPSTDRVFLLAITKELQKLSNTYKIAVIGHPSWEKLPFLDNLILENINAHITSSYKIDYNSYKIDEFIKNYRTNFDLEPGEFAFKGFDTGYYFAKLLSEYNKDFIQNLTKEPFKGLHNNFLFVKDNRFGYYNISLMMLKYEGSQLEKVN